MLLYIAAVRQATAQMTRWRIEGHRPLSGSWIWCNVGKLWPWRGVSYTGIKNRSCAAAQI